VDGRPEHAQDGLDTREVAFRAADENRQRPGLGLGQAAEDGRVEQGHSCRQRLRKPVDGSGPDRRHVHDRGRVLHPAGDSVRSLGHRREGRRVRDHHDHGPRPASGVGRAAALGRTGGDQLARLVRRAVPDRDLMSGIDESARHPAPHRAEPDHGNGAHAM
jgi:hypothetical protein